MKSKIIITSILLASMIISPLINYRNDNSVAKDNTIVSNNTISVMKTENGKIEEVSEKEYLIGVLAAETDLEYADEALKAQVIASHTYLENIMNSNNNKSNVDISDDSSSNQGYLNENERKEKWGKDYECKEKKAEIIVDSVLNKQIYYNNEPIKAVYFELSSGITLSSEDVWGEELPYLKSVKSTGDKLSPEYIKTIYLKIDDLKEMLKNNNINIENSITISLNKNENGYVTEVLINKVKISGEDFRKLLNLNSTVFKIESEKNGYTITTYGKGHMVGMSQYGADYMAKQGADYNEILNHYYPGTVITEI